MEDSIKNLAEYRLENAKKNLALAKELLDKDDFRFAMNRSYYAIFHAIRAVNCLDGYVMIAANIKVSSPILIGSM